MFDFWTRKKIVEVAPFVRRIIDLTTPNRPVPDDRRYELRYNRTFPVLLTPWNGEAADVDRVQVAFTRDLSDRGVGLLSMQQAAPGTPHVLTLWPCAENFPDPIHVLATIRESRNRAAGIWIVGLELEEILAPESNNGLQKLVEIARDSLLPSAQELAEDQLVPA